MKEKQSRVLSGFLRMAVLVFLLLPVTALPVFAKSGTCGRQCKWDLSGKTLKFEYNDTDGSGSLISAAGPVSGLSDAEKQSVEIVVINDNVSAIQDETFSGYTALTSVTFGKDVVNIGKLAFYNCSKLESITIPDSVSVIGEKAFFLAGLSEIKLSNNLTSLGESAFRLTKLKSITIPGKLKVLPKDCFYACHQLQTIKLTAGVQEIGTSAFMNCDSLATISIPSTVTTVGAAAFDSCKKLTSLDLSSVVSIGHLAVKECLGLTEIRLSNVLTDADSQAFLNNRTDKNVIFDGTEEEFAKIANKSESRNTDLLTGTVQCLQSSSDLPKVEEIEKAILNLSGRAEVPGACFHLLRARAVRTKKNRIRLKWKAVPGADGYLIYGGGRKEALQKIDTIKNGNTLTYIHTGLNPNMYYRYIVVAYKNVGSGTEDLRALSCSSVIIAATLGGKFRNTKAVRPAVKKITLKKGKKQKLKVTLESKTSAGEKYRTFLKVRYESTKPSVATVNRNGRIKAVSKGTCYVFAYAQDGIFKRIKVTVK